MLNEVIHHGPELRVAAGKRPGLGNFFKNFDNLFVLELGEHLGIELGELISVSCPSSFRWIVSS